MPTETILGLLLRVLPAVGVLVLGLMAMRDKRTREQWNNLLYQVGSIRPNQREDAKIGSGVKWPFFLVAACLLLWPIQYFRHATRTIDASASDLKIAKPQSDLGQSTPSANSTTAPSQSDLSPPPSSAPNSDKPQSDLSQSAP